MKIVMPTFERIEWMPPTITLIQKLSEMGHEVVYITIYPDNYLPSLGLKNVRNVFLWPKEIWLTKKIPYIKGISGLCFRVDNLVKKIIARKLSKTIKKEKTEASLLWVVNEMTVILGGTSFLKHEKYLFTMYEMHEKTFLNRKIERAARNAARVIVPEYNRAHIIKSRYSLNKLPIVLPNKSDIKINHIQLSPEAKEAVGMIKNAQLQGKKVILYMGGIGPERPLEPILDICKNSEYRLAVMGRESEYLNQLKEKYGHAFDYLGSYPPPMHLAVAQYADIGLLMYVSINQVQGLNALFCAPNKIYEYTGLGLPVIANDIPGLRFEVLSNKIGCVCDFEDRSAILKALNEIKNDYDWLSQNAKVYYNKINVAQIIDNIIRYGSNKVIKVDI